MKILRAAVAGFGFRQGCLGTLGPIDEAHIGRLGLSLEHFPTAKRFGIPPFFGAVWMVHPLHGVHRLWLV